MKTLLIVWHSRTGGARQMAEAAAAAAAEEGVVVRLLAARDAGPEDLLQASGYLFACPENLAALSGEMKEFFDRAYYGVLERIEGRPYGLMVCAGSDGQNAVRQAARIATGWRLRPIADPIVIITGAQTPAAILAPKTVPEPELARCRELGATLAAGLSLGIF